MCRSLQMREQCHIIGNRLAERSRSHLPDNPTLCSSPPPSLPSACFLEHSGSKQSGTHGHLFWSSATSLLKPPDDGFHKHGGYQVRHQFIRERMHRTRRHMSLVRHVATCGDQISKFAAYLEDKPGTSLPAEQRPVEPFVSGASSKFIALREDRDTECTQWALAVSCR